MTTDGHTQLQTGLQEHKSEGEADKRESGETRSETTAGKHGNNWHKNESSGRLVNKSSSTADQLLMKAFRSAQTPCFKF